MVLHREGFDFLLFSFIHSGHSSFLLRAGGGLGPC